MSKKNLGYIETEKGRLDVKRAATGRDLILATAAQQSGGSFIATMISSLCQLKGRPITSNEAEDLDAGILVALISEVQPEFPVIKVSEGNSYPQEYKIGDETFFLKEGRKIRHESKANRMAKDDKSDYNIWIICSLVRDKDDKPLRYDDVLDMPSGVVKALIKVVEPKKPTFVRVSK